jgi:hypothetical protein
MCLHVHNFIKVNVLPILPPAYPLQLKTSAKVDNILYHADARSNAYNGGRHDWVSIQWADELDALPARIIVFFELPDLTFQSATDSPPYYSGSELYAIVASVQKSLYSVSQSADGNKINQRCHQSTQLVYYSKLEQDSTFLPPNGLDSAKMPKLYAVKVDSHKFVKPVVAIPYLWKDTITELQWMFIQP